MPTPKYRTSKSKRNMRRSHHALKAPGMSICSNSNEVKQPHCVGPTGYYKGKLVDPKLAQKNKSIDDFNEQDFE